MASSALERCGNCDGVIGKMETPHIFDDTIVCKACYSKLWQNHDQLGFSPSPVQPQLTRPQYASVPRPAQVMQRVQVIEQTSKVWKAQQIFAFLTAMAGMFFVVVGALGQSQAAVAIGWLGFLGGLCWMIFARLMAWWNHG